MKIASRAIVGILLLGLVSGALASAWFYLYSGDIPGMESIGSFAPDEAVTLYDECSSASNRAVPFTALGKNLVNAAHATEGGEQTLALQVARSMFCNYQGGMLQRHLLVYKASVQLRRRFNESQLLTILLNRAYFGDASAGVENASQRYYQKHPADLNLAEAAMIAGLMKGPGFYSPLRHPDRAKTRRNDVIAAMLKRGTITEKEAEAAAESPVLKN